MAFSKQSIKYGWWTMVGVVITGTTIYVASNARNQVLQKDIIPIPLGTFERCLGTQRTAGYLVSNAVVTTNGSVVTNWVCPVTDTTTNAVISWGIDPNGKTYTIYKSDGTSEQINYLVQVTNDVVCVVTQKVSPVYGCAPSDYEKPWIEVVGRYITGYITNTWTNGVTNILTYITTNYATAVTTNYTTNAIGWHTDILMLMAADPIMKTLPPYYTDEPPGRYDRVVTSLTTEAIFSKMGIGDGINKFTRTPAGTPETTTKWVVNYTNYWPSTNGTATNINYTSGYRQVVNYAQSWTATGGHVWVNSSNWNTISVTRTNATTYGNYPYQIYVLDLQERYKFLWSLKNVVRKYTDADVYTGGTDHATSGKRWSMKVTWKNGSVWRSPPVGTGTLAGCHTTKTASEIRGEGISYWGCNTHTYFPEDYGTYFVDIPGIGEVEYYDYYVVDASTNTTVGAVKTYSYGGWGPSYLETDDGADSTRQEYQVTMTAGTYYNRTHYLGLTPEAESTNMIDGLVTVTITGDDGGGAMPVETTDDSGGGGSWGDLFLADSPKLVYSNSFKSKLEISAGNLTAPDILGTKTYTINKSVGPVKSVVTAGGTGSVVTNLHFQDPTDYDTWYSKFNYCVNKYW